MKLLTVDIETFPAITYTWGMHRQYHTLDQLIMPGRVAGVGWKWHDQRKTHFVRAELPIDQASMVQLVHGLLDDADAVVHYNGASFDIPHLQREMALLGLDPPSPFKQIDLLKAVRKQFRFLSNKLDNVAQEFDVGKKLHHEGFGLWLKCMAGEPAAWNRFERYCKQDVRITEKLYDRILPWIPNHPNVAMFNESADGLTCPACGSTKLQRRGPATTAVGVYHRYQCQKCGKWMRGKSLLSSTEMRGL